MPKGAALGFMRLSRISVSSIGGRGARASAAPAEAWPDSEAAEASKVGSSLGPDSGARSARAPSVSAFGALGGGRAVICSCGVALGGTVTASPRAISDGRGVATRCLSGGRTVAA